jgi:hypothetical protein
VFHLSKRSDARQPCSSELLLCINRIVRGEATPPAPGYSWAMQLPAKPFRMPIGPISCVRTVPFHLEFFLLTVAWVARQLGIFGLLRSRWSDLNEHFRREVWALATPPRWLTSVGAKITCRTRCSLCLSPLESEIMLYITALKNFIASLLVAPGPQRQEGETRPGSGRGGRALSTSSQQPVSFLRPSILPVPLSPALFSGTVGIV